MYSGGGGGGVGRGRRRNEEGNRLRKMYSGEEKVEEEEK